MPGDSEFKSGFAAIVGRPNVGKSTLINRLVGQKVVIVSDKPQTTRHKIHAVINMPDAQVVLIDTPGIHKPRHRLGEYMVDAALSAIKEVDMVLFMVEPMPPGPGDKYVLECLKKVSTPVFLVLNKIDTLEKSQLLPLIDTYSQLFPFKEIIPVSALKGENMDSLTNTLMGYLSPGPRFYPEGMMTDRPEQFIMAELIREKALLLTSQEVPHSLAVVVEEMSTRDNGMIDLRAIIYVERESQKGILIGKGGSMLKRIGQMSRLELETLFGSKFFLELWVKVKEDWRSKESQIKNFGFTST